MSDWQPIDTAPKDGTVILVGDFKERASSEHYCGVVHFECEWMDEASGETWPWKGNFSPTHWMPLPPPPSKESS